MQHSRIIKACEIVMFVLLSFNTAFAQSGPSKFKHLNLDNGLSNNSVKCILKDSRGFMWIGTTNGLNRYDGKDCRVFRNDNNDPHSIVNDVINTLLEDDNDNIWVGTQEGLSIFNRKTEKFHSYIHDIKDSSSLSGISVKKIIKDNDSNIWIATSNGLDLFMPDTKTFKHFKNDPTNKNSLIHNSINDLEIDITGALWIATSNGVDLFDMKKYEFTHFRDTVKGGNLSMNISLDLYRDASENIWLGTTQGLFLFNQKKKKFESVHYDSFSSVLERGYTVSTITSDSRNRLYIGANDCVYLSDKTKTTFKQYASEVKKIGNLKGGIIQSMFFDQKSGLLWIGTDNGGVNFIAEWNDTFLHIKAEEGGLTHRSVSCIKEDNDNNVWLGTRGGGINVKDYTTGKITAYTHTDDPGSLLSNNVLAIEKDMNGNMWVGTYAGGLDMFDKNNHRFIHFVNNPEDSTTLSGNSVYDIQLDKQGNLWIGTEADKGLNLYHAESRTFLRYSQLKVDDENPRNNFIRQIMDDGKGNLLILTFKSIQVFTIRSKKFTRFVEELDKKVNSFQCMLVDRKGNIWIGTNNGLFRVNKERSAYKQYAEKDGLPSSDITAMEEDDNGDLWLSTRTNGLFKIENPNHNYQILRILTYSTDDGLQGREYVSRAAYKGKNNLMYFGGQNGLNIFDPNTVLINQNPPPVVITNLKIFNSEAKIGGSSPLEYSITETQTLTLSHEDYAFSLNFAALNYVSPEKNKYAYMLENFENQWNYIGNSNTATYTNLTPGVYIFRVIASNNYGIWNEVGASLTIIVKPPYWQEWWFRILVSLLSITIVATWFIKRTRNEKRQKILLEEKVRLRTNELMEQKETLKAQREKIEILYTELKDSIRAAETIQTSVLPTEETIKKYLPESFILNKPKDVVSGDFYWFTATPDKIVLALGDCTGHGVSGALMSINAYHLLNEAKQNCVSMEASVILNQFNTLFISYASKQKVNDYGLDISICVLDLNAKTLQFAGANSRIYVITGGELKELKGNSFPIGHSLNGTPISFTDQQITLQRDDQVYLFTDGFADQFGGENGEQKLMYKQFRKLITELSTRNMCEQADYLNQFFIDWKKDNDQTDDVLIIGFKP